MIVDFSFYIEVVYVITKSVLVLVARNLFSILLSLYEHLVCEEHFVWTVEGEHFMEESLNGGCFVS